MHSILLCSFCQNPCKIGVVQLFRSVLEITCGQLFENISNCQILTLRCRLRGELANAGIKVKIYFESLMVYSLKNQKKLKCDFQPLNMKGKDTAIQEKTAAPSKVGRVFKFLCKTVFYIVVLMVVSLIAVNIYLHSNQTKILADLPFLDNASLSFNRMSIRLFEDFPSATVSFSDFLVKDSLFEQHKQPLLQVEELTAAVALQDVFDKKIDLHSFTFRNGQINLFTDKDGYSNYKNLLAGRNQCQINNEKNNFEINTDQLAIDFFNVEFEVRDDLKKTLIKGGLEKLKTDLLLKEKGVVAKTDMIVNLDQLAFNSDKGVFAKNSRITGQPIIEIREGVLNIEPFDLGVNDQVFNSSVNFDFQKNNISTIVFENDKTVLSESVVLLPDDIQKAMQPFQVEDSFYSKTVIEGRFLPDDPPVVIVDFKLNNNTVNAENHVFNSISLNGRFANRIYNDERKWKEGKKRVKVELNNVLAEYDDFKITTPNALITSTKEIGPQLKTAIKITGQPSGISEWLKNDQFLFRKGAFNLSANINGPLKNYEQLVIESEAELNLYDFTAIYLPANSAFPFDYLYLNKKTGDTGFSITSSQMKEGLAFSIEGGIKNLPALVLDLEGQRASSDVVFIANKLSWADFLDLFGEDGALKDNTSKTDEEKKKSMKEMLRGIQHNFQPHFSVVVDTLQYFDLLELHDFKTGIYFENEHTVVLEKTSFEYEEGAVSFNARLNIADTIVTPIEFELHTRRLNLKKLFPPFDYFNIKLLSGIENHPENVSIDVQHKGLLDDRKGLIPNTSEGEIIFKINEGEVLLGEIIYLPDSTENIFDKKVGHTKIALEGMPIVFNEFFKNDQFFFDKGRFFANFEYDGQVANFEELLNKSDANFSIKNGEVYYKPSDVTFPLTEVKLDLRKNHADFDFFLYSDDLNQEIQFKGQLENLSELVLGHTGKTIRTNVDVTSPKLKWEQFLDIFSPEITGDSSPEKQTVDALKATVVGLLTTFNPNVQVNTDTFVFSDQLMLEKVETGIALADTAILVLNKTGFQFYEGSMSVDGVVDLGKVDCAPFTAHFNTQQLDVMELLKSLDYLYLPSLKNIKELSGTVTMDLGLSGIIANDAEGLIPDANSGVLDFELNDITLKGFDPLDQIAIKLKQKNRFKELKFAPISNRLIIDGKNIEIPLMEIQSNALNLFVEGTLSYGDETNIWVSIPVDNLKKADRSIVPAKRNYAATRHKIYIEVTTDEFGENQFKIRSSKKKFYKQRGILEQYKIDKKKWKKWRKENG